MNIKMSLFALSISAFALGLSEFVVIGTLSSVSIAEEIDISTAGHLVSVYALGICLGTPFMTYVTRNIKGKYLCVLLMFTFAVATLLTIAVSGFTALLIFRFVAGLAHGTFFTVATSSIPSIVERNKLPMAIALMFTGLTVAMVLGVPMSMFIVDASSWRTPFYLIVAVCVASIILMIIHIPSNFGICRVDASKKHSSVPITMHDICYIAITIFGFGGGFYLFSYIEPYLQNAHGYSYALTGIALTLVGLGALIGNIVGGFLPGKIGLNVSLQFMLIVQLASLILLGQLENMISPLILFFVWSVSAFSIAPMVQTAVVKEPDNRISTCVNVMAFNIGISAATYMASIYVVNGGYDNMPSITALIVLLAQIPCTYLLFKGKNVLHIKLVDTDNAL